MIALAHYELSPADVVLELERRVGLSGLDEKALRKVAERARDDAQKLYEGAQK
jgi:phosphoribosyl-ATP pyrophosphohydrolase